MEAQREPATLISTSKVVGTDVYNTAGEALGDIYDVMVDKRSGKIAYAVMSFGGFLGIGTRYHPLPWSTLTYDPRKAGYVVPMSKEVLQRAPTVGADEGICGDRVQEQTIHDYYKTRPYWDA